MRLLHPPIFIEYQYKDVVMMIVINIMCLKNKHRFCYIGLPNAMIYKYIVI